MHGDQSGRGPGDPYRRQGDDPPTGAIDDATPGVDSVLGREVAMVVLPPAAGEELAVRTERVRRLAGLHHPNLVEIFDVDGLAADTESTLVLQHVTGRGLDELPEPWHPESLARVAAQVTAGLAHAHAHGVVHGVIGPASVVVDASLQAWLTGFTATLRPGTGPAAETAAHSGPVPVATPEADVAVLGRALSNVVGGSAPAVLMTVLTAMVDGAVTAREAAELLTRAAETLSAGEEDTGLIVVPTRYWRAPGTPANPEPDEAAGVTEAVGVNDAAGPPGTGLAGAGLAGVRDEPARHAAPAAPPLPPVPALPARSGHGPTTPPRTRKRDRVRRAALLSGAAATVALASAFAIWAGEGPSGATSRSTPSGSTGPVPDTDVGRPLGGSSHEAPNEPVASRGAEPGLTSHAERSILPTVVPQQPVTPAPRTPSSIPSTTRSTPTTPTTTSRTTTSSPSTTVPQSTVPQSAPASTTSRSEPSTTRSSDPTSRSTGTHARATSAPGRTADADGSPLAAGR